MRVICNTPVTCASLFGLSRIRCRLVTPFGYKLCFVAGVTAWCAAWKWSFPVGRIALLLFRAETVSSTPISPLTIVIGTRTRTRTRRELVEYAVALGNDDEAWLSTVEAYCPWQWHDDWLFKLRLSYRLSFSIIIWILRYKSHLQYIIRATLGRCGGWLNKGKCSLKLSADQWLR